MIRHILTILLLLLAISAEAQNYIFEFKVDYHMHHPRRRYYQSVYYTTEKNVNVVIPEWGLYQGMGNHTCQGKISIPAKSGPIRKIRINSFWQKKGIWWDSDNGSERDEYIYQGESSEFDLPKDTYLGYVYTLLQGTIYTIHYIRMYPELLFEAVQPQLLPLDDRVVLKNQAGFPRSVYKWQYSLDAGSSWIDVPASLIDSSPSGSLSIQGKDLMTEVEYLELARQGKNIQFRINNPVKPSSIITLRTAISTPHIVSSMLALERCHRSDDASIKFQLDRALFPNEVLNAFVLNSAGMTVKTFSDLSVDTNNTLSLGDFPAGTYTFKFQSSFHQYGAFSGGQSHELNLTIAERPAITHSFTKQDVSCFAGTDGSISLTASGGTGSFVAHLFDASGAEIRKQNFTSTATLSRLPAGQYTLKVYDSNDCFAKDGGGNELVHSITLIEPSEAVTLSEEALVSPLAHNSSDGSISIRAIGGTPLANGYNVRFIRKSDGQSFNPSSVRPDGDAYVYTLSGIPRGEYTAVVEDARYSALAPEDKNSPCGCRAELAVTLTAPPPLEVEVKESHYVSCHGDSNGEITAHAKGGKPSTTTPLPYTYTWYKLSNGTSEILSLQTDNIARGLVAGQYQVKVTDANGISILSNPFTLVQPEPLDLKFKVSSPSCSGGSGSIEAIVSGGTAPYAYEWNKEGETTKTLGVSEVGIYFLRVTDSRGCSIEGTAEVTAPDALDVRSELVHPSCFATSNGSIKLNVSGGTAPYTIRWEDKAGLTSLQRDNLRAGDYVALVSDALGCTMRYRFTLTEPKELEVKLSEPFTLCKDQSRNLIATASEEGVRYKWHYNGQELSESSSELSVTEAGIYRVVVTNESGCTAAAEVLIRESQVELPIDITAPSTVHVGTEIHVVNISRVKADRLKWHLPPGAVVSTQNDDRLIFTMSNPGVYNVALEGILGDCSSIVNQRIEVLSSGAVVLPDGKSEALIKQFLVSPNPTTGAFKVFVELREAQDFTLRLLSPTMVEMDKKQIKQQAKQTFEYELRGETTGIYTVELRVGEERSLLKVTKQKQ